MPNARETAIAETRRELAELAAIDVLCNAENGRIDDLTASNAPTPGGRRRRDRPGANGASATLSLRLDHPLMEALERRAALGGMPPSALARNLIRVGLSRQNALSSALVDELESVTARLRTAIT